MRITCPACRASYEIPDHLLVHTPERVRCARCGAEWAWARALSKPEENFELPDLFSDSPPSHAAREPVPDLRMLTDPDPPRDLLGNPPLRAPIGSPVFDIGSELSLSPPAPLDRLVPLEAPAPVARPPSELAAREAQPAEQPRPELPLAESPLPEPPPPAPPLPAPRKETPVDIPEVPFPKAPAVQERRSPPPVRAETPVEIPEVPFPREQKAGDRKREPKIDLPTVSNLAHERAMSREEAFRRVIETTRQRSQAAPPRRPSRRPQIIAILAVILLVAVIFGVHFALVHGLVARITG